MFTIEQINDIHERLGTMKDFLSYVTALKLLGVQKYDSYLIDGHSEFFGAQGYCVGSAPIHEILVVAEISDKESFIKHLSLHEKRETDYITMCRGLAESGIEKWVVDTRALTIS